MRRGICCGATERGGRRAAPPRGWRSFRRRPRGAPNSGAAPPRCAAQIVRGAPAASPRCAARIVRGDRGDIRRDRRSFGGRHTERRVSQPQNTPSHRLNNQSIMIIRTLAVAASAAAMSATTKPLRIGTRGSPLALAQAYVTREGIQQRNRGDAAAKCGYSVAPRLRRGHSVATRRGDAAGAAWIVQRAGEGMRSRRSTDGVGSGRLRRGCHVDIPWRRVAAKP